MKNTQHRLPKTVLYTALFLMPGLATADAVCPLFHVGIDNASDSSGNDGHGPEYTIDRNLMDGSRWSSAGDGQEISYDLGAVKSVSQIDMAFYQGDVRKTFFKVDTSLDGKTWNTAIERTESNGSTSGFEAFPFSETEARFVRVTGYGNSNADSSKWNSIIETRIMSCTQDMTVANQPVTYITGKPVVERDQKLVGDALTLRPKLYGHAAVYPESEIVDGQFSILGNDAPKGVLYRNPKGGVDGTPAYLFRLNGGRRIELSTAYVSDDIAAQYTPEYVTNLLKIEDVYRLSNLGEYGDTFTYEWSVRFPYLPANGQEGIISQWHGRPDKTLTQDPEGNLTYNSVEEMVDIRNQMDISAEIDQGIGYVKGTQQPNGWKVDSYQRPIGELAIYDNYLYLFFRNDPNRLSGTDADSPVPHPGKNPLPYIKEGNKVSSVVVWERKLSDVPVDEWIDLKLEIKYATYSETEDKVLESGYAKFWVNGKLEADYQGAIGKNDQFPPYFQHGVYTGRGMAVDHSGYRYLVNGTPWTLKTAGPIKTSQTNLANKLEPNQ